MSCIDELAGDAVLNACEKTLFGSAESAAAAVAYAASQITRLTGRSAMSPPPNKNTTPELQALRRAVERDRYGLMAYVLMARDHCTPAVLRGVPLAGRHASRSSSNMDERVYDEPDHALFAVMERAGAAAAATGLVAALPPSMPTGKPTNAEFPICGFDAGGQHHDA